VRPAPSALFYVEILLRIVNVNVAVNDSNRNC